MPVGVHVVGIDVGDRRNDRIQHQEGRIGLVRLGHQEFALPQARVGAHRRQPTADDEGRIGAAFGEDARHQRGSGGLAMRAGDRDALLEAHQFGQHLRARHQRHAALTRGHHFRIVVRHGGRRDHCVGMGHVVARMTDEDARAEPLQTTRGCALLQVGAGDHITEVEQHLGDAAHADASDAHEMNVLDLVFHAFVFPAASASHTSATSSAARGRARARAAIAIFSRLARSCACNHAARPSAFSCGCGSSQAAP